MGPLYDWHRIHGVPKAQLVLCFVGGAAKSLRLRTRPPTGAAAHDRMKVENLYKQPRKLSSRRATVFLFTNRTLP
jgi:hypothetical protein